MDNLIMPSSSNFNIVETDMETYGILREMDHLRDDVAYFIKDCPDYYNGSKITMNGEDIYATNPWDTVSNNVMEEIEKIKRAMSAKVTMVHNCQNCGATLDIEENRPVFHCKYCGAVYLIGTERLMQAY